MNRLILFLLAALFVMASFFPSAYEWSQSAHIPPERTFFLEHNYLFDYNFYLSRIRQGQEGRWLVTEKYYNQPHPASLFQIIYLVVGKVGGWMGLTPPMVYHVMRLVLGWLLLVMVGWLIRTLLPGRWGGIGYLVSLTAGSWPVVVWLGTRWRLGTFMGWWSVVDSLQRITTLPHVLLGQFFLVLFLWRFITPPKGGKLVLWGGLGLLAGIIFPPTSIMLGMIFLVQSGLELVVTDAGRTTKQVGAWLTTKALPRMIVLVLSAPALVYAQIMFGVMPWKALALFDLQHRINLPYDQYALALGPILPLGLIGLLIAIIRREKAQIVPIAWVLSIGLLFLIFEPIPTQSPLRFTEGLVHVPLSILTTYFLLFLWQWGADRPYRRVVRGGVLAVIVALLGLGMAVMGSMELWKMDEAVAKGKGTWPVPLGNQLVYPLTDFMNGVYYLRDQTPKEAVVLSYITAGNYIPAYAGQYVYIGHANTPDEDKKEPIAAAFFSGNMTQEQAQTFLRAEHISYVYVGPQESNLASGKQLTDFYPFLQEVYTNPWVIIYRFP